MADEIYILEGTRVTFEASGGDVTFSMGSIGADDGQISAQWDRGASARPQDFIIQLRCGGYDTDPDTASVNRIYMVESMSFRSGGTPAVDQPGELPSTDSAITDEDELISFARPIGQLAIPPNAVANDVIVSPQFQVTIKSRYVQFGIWNDVPDAWESSPSTAHEIAVYPVPPQIQS